MSNFESCSGPEESAGDLSEFTSTGEFSITNPFENQNTIDSLLQPSFSPSVFSKDSSSQPESERTPNSFWTIDQIAVLKPAEIDVSGLHNQQDFVRLDPASERRAQQAIDEFFANRVQLTSPWSADRSNNHYLALISPSPAQMKKRTAYMTPGSSTASSVSSQIRVRRLQLSSKNILSESSSKSKSSTKSCAQRHDNVKETKNVSTQTALTLPRDFDLEAVLSRYYTFGQANDNSSEAPSNTSLRRKLFFPDGREVETRDRHGDINFNALQHIDGIEDLENFIDSPVPLKKIQPEKNNLTPMTHTGRNDIPRTPGSSHSHFSSSPVASCDPFDPTTPCASDFPNQRLGSGIRPRKMILGSSEDEELLKLRMQAVTSPELSPVQRDVSSENKGHLRLCRIEASGPVDESMSFRLCQDGNMHNVAPGNSGDAAKNPDKLESSRRQVVMDSPPFSPIEPIQCQSKSSSSYAVNSSQQGLFVSKPPRALCPSPMLSPIPGKHLKNSSDQSESAGHQKPTSSLLSSTVTRGASSKSELFSSIKESCEKQQSSEIRPFQSYESKSQFSVNADENKENLCPPSAVPSNPLNFSQDDADVSMSSYHASYYEGYMCNDNDSSMHLEKNRSSMQFCGKQTDDAAIEEKVTTGKQPFNQLSFCEDHCDVIPHGSMGIVSHKPETCKRLSWKINNNMDVSES